MTEVPDQKLVDETSDKDTSDVPSSDKGSEEVFNQKLPFNLHVVPPGGKVQMTAINPEDIPYISHYSTGVGNVTIQCMICQQPLEIRGKERQYVVKCENCNEATPIRPPPADKKYVRCLCNCLLICRVGAVRIICPRDHCRRILDLTPHHRAPESSVQLKGNVKVACIFCDRSFAFNTEARKLAQCPHCTKKSAVGREYARKVGLIYLSLSLLVILIGVAVTLGTMNVAKNHLGLYTLYVCLFAVGVILTLRAVYFLTLPVSPVIGPA